MNDTLKAAGRIGAELGAAKAEVERLRGEITRAVREFDECDAFNAEGRAVELMEELRAALSQQADHVRDAAQMMVPSKILKAIAWGDRDDAAEAIGSLRCLLADHEGEDEIAFPDSPEPTDTYTAVDMATAAAQGVRDGQAAVEPAPAQDERECVTGGTVSELLAAIMHFGSEKWAEGRGAADPELPNVRAAWDSVYSLVQDLATRPAQTEQQLVAVPEDFQPLEQRPIAYPHEAMDKLAADRYRVGAAGAGTLHGFAVRAGDGEQELYRGSKSDCEHVARKLAGAFLDGGFTAFERYAAPIAQTDPWQPSGADYGPCRQCGGEGTFEAALRHAPQPEQSGYLPLSLTELLQRYRRDLELRTFPDNDEGDYQLRWTAKEIERVNAALSTQGAPK